MTALRTKQIFGQLNRTGAIGPKPPSNDELPSCDADLARLVQIEAVAICGAEFCNQLFLARRRYFNGMAGFGHKLCSHIISRVTDLGQQAQCFDMRHWPGHRRNYQ